MNLIKKQTENTWLPSLLEEFFKQDWEPRLSSINTTLPAVNVKDLQKEFLIEIAVPGLQRDNFEIEVDNDLLSISSSVDNKEELKEGKFTRREFSYQGFRRSFTLPDMVDANKIKANYVDGILVVRLPKLKEALPQPKKRIAIG